MHLTCFGNIVLIAILVVLALFLIGLGGAVGSYFESKDHSLYHRMTTVIPPAIYQD